MIRHRALEFFSGIGAFASAAASSRGKDIEIVAAYDQSELANRTYGYLHGGFKPSSRNLDSISPDLIEQADIWWLSPPCTPYTVRGARRDIDDSRARSLLNLLEIVRVLASRGKNPSYILLENVNGFKESRMEAHLLRTLGEVGYAHAALDLCPTDFGVPMSRPRIFHAFASGGSLRLPPPPAPSEKGFETLSRYLESDCDPALYLDSRVLEKFEAVLNIVDEGDACAKLICFTSGYYKCRKASGSLLRTARGVRFFSPAEIMALLGFENIPALPGLDYGAFYRLLGNSVDVRSIRYLLSCLNLSGSDS